MIAVTWQLSRAAVVDLSTAGLIAIGAIGLIYFRFNPAWLVGGGALIGLAAQRALAA